jgi:hypothetical protein
MALVVPSGLDVQVCQRAVVHARRYPIESPVIVSS